MTSNESEPRHESRPAGSRRDDSSSGSILPTGRDAQSLRGITWGLQFGLTILVFTGLGWFIDDKLGTSPWILIASVFVGFGGALYSLVLKANANDPDETNNKKADGESKDSPKRKNP